MMCQRRRTESPCWAFVVFQLLSIFPIKFTSPPRSPSCPGQDHHSLVCSTTPGLLRAAPPVAVASERVRNGLLWGVGLLVAGGQKRQWVPPTLVQQFSSIKNRKKQRLVSVLSSFPRCGSKAGTTAARGTSTSSLFYSIFVCILMLSMYWYG